MRKSWAVRDVREGTWVLFPRTSPVHPLEYGRVDAFYSDHKADERRWLYLGAQYDSDLVEGDVTVFDAVACDCYFCGQDMPHPERHMRWMYSTRLMIPESLSDIDRVSVRQCSTCGHAEQH